MRNPEEKQFISHDGTALFYRYWPAAGGNRERALVLLHRGHEHSGRLQHLVDELALPDYALFACDSRGHGQSPGARGDSPSLATSVKDVDGFVRHIVQTYGISSEQIAVVAQSVGAVLAATWVHDYAPRIRALVLAAPAFQVKLYVPLARPGLRLLYRLRGNFYVNSYVKARFLTHDPARIESYNRDPLITRAISVRSLLALYEAAERVIADAQAIQVPTLLLISGADWVVRRRPQREFFDRLGAAVKRWQVLPGFYHDTLGERDRQLAIEPLRAFILERFAQPPSFTSLQQADQHGFTYDERVRLQQPLPPWSLRNLRFALSRLALRTVGRLSAGIRLGLETGFDSGSMLDYVYRNQATGTTWLGRWIDRGYLNAIGWRGIRQRKRHLEQAIAQAAACLRTAGQPLRIADLAAGHGRYVLAAVAQLAERPEAIRLRDYSELNVHAAMALIAEQRLQDVARCELGDAFDRQSVAALTPRPTVAIVSGLYELFPDNAPVQASLQGLAQAVVPGGYLIYTNQPWHPQLELIARTLTSHRAHQPWVMRRRTQVEMDELVTVTGFDKCEQWTDDWGIFTVSLAVRR